MLAVGIFSSVRKPHTRRGSFLPCSPGGGRREAPRPQGFPLNEAAFWSEERGTPPCRGFPYGLTPVIEGSPGSPTPAGFSPLFLQVPRIKLPKIPYPRYSRQLGNPASPSLRGKSHARRVPPFSGKGAGLFSVRQQGRTGNSPCRGKGLMPSSLNPRE